MRHHSALFGVPWLNGDCYRHSCWISVADAKARGIKDGDLVRVYSSVGEMIIPGYVTSRIIPGVAAVFHGGMYQPGGAKTDLMPDGVDRGGNQNFLIEDNQPGRMRVGPTLRCRTVSSRKIVGDIDATIRFLLRSKPLYLMLRMCRRLQGLERHTSPDPSSGCG